MGAYNRTNGEPCCGHTYLMEEVLRGKWNFEGHFISDCWAIKDFHETTGLRKCQGVRCPCPEKGCDVNCGNTYLHLLGAIEDGLITEEDITLAAERLEHHQAVTVLAFDGASTTAFHTKWLSAGSMWRKPWIWPEKAVSF